MFEEDEQCHVNLISTITFIYMNFYLYARSLTLQSQIMKLIWDPHHMALPSSRSWRRLFEGEMWFSIDRQSSLRGKCGEGRKKTYLSTDKALISKIDDFEIQTILGRKARKLTAQ